MVGWKTQVQDYAVGVDGSSEAYAFETVFRFVYLIARRGQLKITTIGVSVHLTVIDDQDFDLVACHALRLPETVVRSAPRNIHMLRRIFPGS